jgi:ATP-dependent exoDNAse (exonuclease V) alpha subunit
MAIYHLSMKIVGRGNGGPKLAKAGKSTVAMAAYRSAEKIMDERTGIEYDYTRKDGVVDKEILAPKNSPEWICDREKLWNEVEKVEKRKNAQLAREIDIALPIELTHEENKLLVGDFVNRNFTSKGIVVDVAYHTKEKNNPHVHLMLTRRYVLENGFGDIIKDLYGGEFKGRPNESQKEYLMEIRKSWADFCNEHLSRKQFNERVDHRTLKAQGVERLPQIHLGHKVKAMMKKGINSVRLEIYKKIKEFNENGLVELEEYKKIRDQILIETGDKRKVKKYMPKNDNFHIVISVYRSYNDNTLAKFFSVKGSKALYNLNTSIGKKATIEFIYKAHEMLKKVFEIDRLLVQELKELNESYLLIRDLASLTNRGKELQSNVISRVQNKKEIFNIETKIFSIKKALEEKGITDNNTYDLKFKEYNEKKLEVEGLKKNYKEISDARKAIRDAKTKMERLKDKEVKKQQHNYMKRRRYM